MFVDSHCHLSMPALRERLPEILDAMAAASVDRALTICTTIEDFDNVLSLAREHAHLWATVGVHPDEEDVREPTVDELVALAGSPKVVALGETGLDYYRLNGRSTAEMQWQRDRFAAHIRAARRTGLPLVIHTRSASEDTVALLKAEGEGAVRGVFHCFTETMAVARAALDLGFLISFSGILTFKNAGDLREVARFVPLDRCLIETDSPYLAPVPHRGKTNSPAYVPFVARQIAELKGVTTEAVAQTTSANFEALFGIPPLERR
ncbi:TatD family hydrolase [Aquabacterium sp. J223]|uniref:TatD family hydrolase n=1 Tax=Aquabacterium sp. J223 TaxID=2898431 RepID=UPI0021ADB33F|nr:TatD family hydrolase [Aquabacterium sp. J223]UUX94291.1 TatD family hydrolase [Aquabacterium sp. J223]